MEYLVNPEFKGKEIYLTRLHVKVEPSLLNQTERKNLCDLGYGFLFYESWTTEKELHIDDTDQQERNQFSLSDPEGENDIE